MAAKGFRRVFRVLILIAILFIFIFPQRVRANEGFVYLDYDIEVNFECCKSDV